jgi:hypothetical protein
VQPDLVDAIFLVFQGLRQRSITDVGTSAQVRWHRNQKNLTDAQKDRYLRHDLKRFYSVSCDH